MSAKCYRCGGTVESRDNIQGWGFLGGFINTITERAEAKRVRVRSTTVRYKDSGPWPTVTDDTLPLCRSCWMGLMDYLGVGKRKAWIQ